MQLIAASMLIASGYGDVGPLDWFELDRAALMIGEACGDGPREEPAGLDCVASMAAVWEVETGHTFTIYPSARGTGCGVGQVIPTRLGNVRIGWNVTTPPCDGLRVPRVGFAWAVYMLRLKRQKVGRRRMFGAYNGSPLRERYQRRAERTYRRAVRACRRMGGGC